MAGRADVVRIEAGSSRGTGFLIDADHVLTALHVIGYMVEGELVLYGRITITAAVADGTGFRLPRSLRERDAVIAFDATLDWACVAIDRGAFRDVEPLVVRDIADADQNAVWDTYGFPDGAADDGKASGGTIVSTGAMVHNAAKALRVIQVFAREAAAHGEVRGYSGAPVIVGGRAIAILCFAQIGTDQRSAEGTLYGVPLANLSDQLPREPSAPANDRELCIVTATSGSVQLAGCLVTDDPAALRDELVDWRTTVPRHPQVPSAVRHRMLNATLREQFAEPILRGRLLEHAATGSYALYAYYVTAQRALEQLVERALVHRLRKKRQRITMVYARTSIDNNLSAAITQVEREQARTLPRPAVSDRSPVLELADALFAIVAVKLADRGSESVESEFVFLRAKLRLAFDLETRESHTRTNPL